MTVITYSLARDGGKALSKNFIVKEFACADGSDKIFIDSELVLLLQKIRDHFGRPIILTSAYRSPAYNKKVGGSTNSYHPRGMAADHYIDGVEQAEIAAYAEKLGVLGIGLYPAERFVHVDTRVSRYLWQNKGAGEVAVSSHGGLPTYAEIIRDKAGLGPDSVTYLQSHRYHFDLLEKLALAMK
jgi:hypothetical protein